MIDEYLDIKRAILEKIEEYETIIIHCHVRADGDAIGSSFGLRSILRESFPLKKIYSVGEKIPEYLTFLGEMDEISDEEYNNSLVIVVDTALTSRIADQRYRLAKEIIKIDHHIATEDYGDINYVRDNVCAACEMIVDFYSTFSGKLVLNKDAALCLYTGLVTDSGRFKYSDVKDTTFKAASILTSLDIDTQKMYSHLQVKDASVLKMQGYVYNNFKVSENGVAYIFLTKEIVEKYGSTIEDAANLVNSLDSIKGSLIWILFLQYDDEIRVRLRSRFVKVVDIAMQFNGGGHNMASGATVYSIEEMQKLINVSDEALRVHKMQHPEDF